MPRTKLSLGLLPWVTVQCGLPHSRQRNPDGTEALLYERTNGHAHLLILADPEVGLPFGKVPRLILAHLVAEYSRRLASMTAEQARVIDLGSSWSAFLRQIGMEPRGGERGDYARFQEQAWRLFTADIQSWDGSTARPTSFSDWERHAIADQGNLWWHPPKTNRAEPEGANYIRLSERFAEACVGAVPVDLRTMVALRSPFALDLYAWLSHRCGKLHEQGAPPAEIPWACLQRQFGHGYGRMVDFRRAFRRNLRAVLEHYPARVDHQRWPEGIVVWPCPPSVARRA